MATKEEIIKNFISKISFGDCWEWTAFTTDTGYGYYSVNLDGQKKNYRAHRFSWIITNGLIPDGMSVLHKCDNKLCVNPDHLYLGDQRDNLRDALERGQMTSETQGKLKWDQVHKIRELYADGMINSKLSNMFGVSHSTIHSIVNNKTWVEG